jgi:hypothetical protein
MPAGGALEVCGREPLVAWVAHQHLTSGTMLLGEWSRDGLSRGKLEHEVAQRSGNIWFERSAPNVPGEYKFELSYEDGRAIGSWDVNVTCTPLFELLGFSTTNQTSEGAVPAGGKLTVCSEDRPTVWFTYENLVPGTELVGSWFQDGLPFGETYYEPPNPSDQIWFDHNPPVPPGRYTFKLSYEDGETIGSWDVNVNCTPLQ